MNEITQEISKQYVPEAAIVIYENGGDYYLERHPIIKGKMGAGAPLDKEDLLFLSEYFSDYGKQDSSLGGKVPPNLVFALWGIEKKILIWTNPAILRHMYFTPDLHIKNGVAAQPELVYVLNEKNLDIYAKDAKGNLYCAPYHNVSKDGDVCLGNAKVPKPKDRGYISLMEYYEKLFWNSEFSHLNANESLVKGNINTYWNAAIKSKKSFDNKILIPHAKIKTVQKLIEHYEHKIPLF